MDLSRRRFLALSGSVVLAAAAARKPHPHPRAAAPSGPCDLSAEPGRAAPGGFWPGGAA